VGPTDPAPEEPDVRAPVVLLSALALVAALVPSSAAAQDQVRTYPACEHPYPCGDEWPDGLDGPFAIPEVQDVTVTSHDGAVLAGWLWVPDLPAGVGAPTVLVSSPYNGLVPPLGPVEGRLIEQGYAVAAFSVRGTGRSGGCFENKGPREQRDQAVLVEWLAEQPWSSGRVAMMGLSYPGTTPLMAAIRSPEALKAIVPMGPVTDPFTEMHSPNGAIYAMAGPNEAGRRGAVTAAPTDHLVGGPADPATLPQRACPEVARVLAVPTVGTATDDRDAAYWRDRNLTMGFPGITAAVLIGHGLQERAHPFQEDPMWEAITDAPKHMVLGQWAHEPPTVDGWWDVVDGWLDFWLKGLGDPPAGLGTVRYGDDAGVWRTTTAWPPAEAREEVLYLGPSALSPTAADAARSFRDVRLPRTSNVPVADGGSAAGWPLCDRDTGAQVAWASAPLAEDLVLAGNPKAWLRLRSSDVAGVARVGLYALPAGAGCEAAELLSDGAVDLRFTTDTYTGSDFPVDQPTGVRVDLTNLAARVPAGDRLVVLVGAPEAISHHEANNPLADERTSRTGQTRAAEITVEGVDGDPASSHVVLPVLEGSLGGATPTLAYPPRPNVPAEAAR
jgi:putative CocE/NonD family hydrolase